MVTDISLGVAVSAVMQILLLGVGGYGLVKSRIMDKNGLGLLTRLLIKFFLPQFMFYHLTKNFNFRDYPQWWIYPAIGFAIILTGWVISRSILFFFPQYQHKKEFMALVIFQNSGYIPLLLVTTLLPIAQAEKLYVYIFLLLIGFNLGMWSLGVWLLSGRPEGKTKFRDIFNPPLAAMLFSLIFIALGFQRFMPQTLLTPIKMFSGCVLPLAMIVIGGNLATIKPQSRNIKEIFSVVGAKLIIFPLLGLMVIKIFHLSSLLGFLIIVETIVPSAVTLSIIASYYQGEEQFINQGILFTHIFSLMTIPVFLMIYGKVIQGF